MAKLYDIQTGQSQVVAQHDAPIKAVRWYEEGSNHILITGSWDKTVKYWDLRSPQPIGQLNVGERVYAMDNVGQLLAVATAERKVHVVNLTNPTTIFKTLDSPLKWQLRTLACFPNGTGFALGSIEGRVAIQYVDDKNKSYVDFSSNFFYFPNDNVIPTVAKILEVTILFDDIAGITFRSNAIGIMRHLQTYIL
jgi:mRNA export factor